MITPFAGDQLDHAYLVNTLGVGVGTAQFSTLSTRDLATALRTALHTPAMRSRARELAEQERKCDGVGRALTVINDLCKLGIQSIPPVQRSYWLRFRCFLFSCLLKRLGLS